MSDYTVIHRPSASRGEFQLEQGRRRLGYLDYSIAGDVMRIHYVEVDPSLRGAGLGRRLIEAAVAWAREERKQIVPICGYARTVLHRVPEFADVLKS